MAVRVTDWRPTFRRNLTATQAATTTVKFIGAGHTGDGTYDDFDTNMEDDGQMPASDWGVLQGGGWMIEATSVVADARDLIVKLEKALFRIVINNYAELDWTPVVLFPAGAGWNIATQDTVTAGRDLWASMGVPDPRIMQGFNMHAVHEIQIGSFKLPVQGGISIPPSSKWYIEMKLETALALTTGNTAGLRFCGRGVYASTRVN